MDLSASHNAIYCKLKRFWTKYKNMRTTGKFIMQLMLRKHKKLRAVKRKMKDWEKEKAELNKAIVKHNK